MVEYCEGSGCRRKKILESFGEQVPSSLCGKSCDACKQPNLVAKRLEELNRIPSISQKNGLSPVFINSLLYIAAEDQVTEFWNGDDEASCSDEDISDCDDDAEVVSSIARSKLPSKSKLNEKIKFLQRAEEAYYQKKVPHKETSSSVVDKRAISEALREASKQRLLAALKQTQQRVGNLTIELEASATILENECYKKYGKVGKTFYNSQVASTVRWLSTSSLSEINERLGANSTQINGDHNLNPLSMPSLSVPKAGDQDQQLTEANKGRSCSIVKPETSHNSVQMVHSSRDLELPPIPSFSEFVNEKGKVGRSDDFSLLSKNIASRIPKNMDMGNHGSNDSGKRMRLQ